jgi:hypothetical protein
MVVLIQGDGVAGQILAEGTFEGADLGRGGGHFGEGGGASEVDAQRLAHELGAAAVLAFAHPLDLPGDRPG